MSSQTIEALYAIATFSFMFAFGPFVVLYAAYYIGVAAEKVFKLDDKYNN